MFACRSINHWLFRIVLVLIHFVPPFLVRLLVAVVVVVVLGARASPRRPSSRCRSC